jgi:hypothetical protein
LGNKIWSISKVCPINSEYNLSWYFRDDTNELIWKEGIYQTYTEEVQEGGCH